MTIYSRRSVHPVPLFGPDVFAELWKAFERELEDRGYADAVGSVQATLDQIQEALREAATKAP